MKRARVKEAALAVLLREGFNSETAERLADLIAHEPIAIGAKNSAERPGLEKLEKALERVTEPH
jgi:hypothetical protein